MLTHDECIAKPVEMQLQAIVRPNKADDYRQLARQWRWVAEHAKWHVAHEERFL